nr:PDF receptor isoform X2 [Danaus plexippus plexippus]
MAQDKLQLGQDKIITLKNLEVTNLKECIERYLGVLNNGTSYCNVTFDSYLCWPPTEPGTVVRQPCPRVRLSDPSQYASRRCGILGTWDSRPGRDAGWTNYTSCLPANAQEMVSEIIKHDDKYSIILGTRYMEIVGFIVSFIFLSTSLYILTYFTVLQNTRNKIHMNLFAAMTIQTLSRLVIYLDQLFNVRYGISHTPIVCETCYVIMECTCSAMFAWMLIEGIYIRYLISKKIMKSFDFKIYCWFAWGVTIFFTTVWAFSTKPNHVDETSVKVVTILTPLLGIVNILNMIDISIYSPTWKFAVWLYVSHFLRSFQGCFLSLFYCLFNGEVRKTLKRKIQALSFWKYFSWERPANNNSPRVVNHLLSDELMDSVPPPPFFRIDSAGNPTTRLECGCRPRIDVEHPSCSLEAECVIEMNDCCEVLCEDSVPSCCTEQHSARIVVYPEIHAPPPQRRQRSEPVEIIEMIETTV